MPNLKTLKNQAQNVRQANDLCRSMSNLSAVKAMIFSKKLKVIQEKLEILGGVIFLNHIDLLNIKKPKKIFAFFSDFGFCGEFNDHIEKNFIPVGKKGKSTVRTNNLTELNEFIATEVQNNYNFEILIKDFHSGLVKKFSPSSFIQKNQKLSQNMLLEYKTTSIFRRFFDVFIDFIFCYGQLQENFYRSKIMKNAVDNSKKWLESLTISVNKTRQMLITNEILLIVSCQGVTS